MLIRILSFTILLILTTNSVFGQLIDLGSYNLKTSFVLEWLPPRAEGVHTMGLSNYYFEVGEFGWSAKATPNVKHPPYYYPFRSPENFHESGSIYMMMETAYPGDFNNDGYQDFVMTWYLMPHVSTREGLLGPLTIYLNNKDGSFTEMDFDRPLRYFMYRPTTGNFNNDGFDDVVAAVMGKVTECYEDYTCNYLPDRIPIILSDSSGNFTDVSDRVEGQENNEVIQNFNFAHDLAVGDVNGDGLDDFYQGKQLFITSDSSFFINFSDSLPSELRPENYMVMSSAVGDVNGDGFGDVISMPAGNRDSYDIRGYVWLSNGSPFQGRKIHPLPTGRYFSNPGPYSKTLTKFNHTVVYDIDRDGIPEIVTAVTREDPYYVGSHLQIFKYKGQQFIDITEDWIDFDDSFDEQHGEGFIYIVDMNNDGILDIVHQLFRKIQIYLNDGNKLHIQPSRYLPEDDEPYGIIPHVREFQVVGAAYNSPFYWDQEPIKSFPLNIDNKHGIDFIRSMSVPLLNHHNSDSLSNATVLYSVINKRPLKFSPPEGEINLVGPVDGITLNTNFVRFEWENNPTVDYYRVEITTDSSDFKLLPHESFINTKTYLESTYVVFDSLDTQLTYYWRVRGENNMGTTEFSEVRSFTTGTLTSVGVDDPSTLPVEYSLNQNYPNPFNPTTTITYSLPQSGMVTLNVYDITGRFITTLVNGVKGVGTHTVQFEGSSLSSGMYVYTLQTDGYRQTRQMMLVK